MSSDVAVYFPEGMASAFDVRGSARGIAEVSSKPAAEPGEVVEEPVAAIAQTPEIPDELLMEQIQQGTKEALVPLFRRHAHVVRSVACRILRNETEADDLVQEVFLFVFRKARLFDASKATARSWIVQVTYHRAIDRRRYLISRHFYSSLEIEPSVHEPIDHHREILQWEKSFEGVWGRKGAAELRSLLSADQLRTIELHFFEGYTLEEIAEGMGQSLVNVRHHYYRGLDKLRKPAFARKLQPK